MNQPTWKCTTKSDIVWQNWNQNWVVEGAKGIMQSCIAAISYETWPFKIAQGPSESCSRESQGPPWNTH